MLDMRVSMNSMSEIIGCKETILCAFFIVGKQESERVGEVPLMEKWKEEARARARGRKMEKMI